MAPSPTRPVSRRDRPAKPALNREAIVAAAVRLLRTEGLERLTMRRLAATLDTGAASLYVYFHSTEQLHSALLDALLGDVELSPVASDGPWRERLARVVDSYTAVLFEYPSVARLSVFTRPSGPHGLQLFEALLALLDEGGVAPGAAAWGVDLIVQYATSTAAEHSSRDEQPGTAEEERDLARSLAELAPDTHPHLYRLRSALLSGEGRARFHWGLDVILSGLADPDAGGRAGALDPASETSGP